MTDTATDNRLRSAPRPHRRLVMSAAAVSAILAHVVAPPASADDAGGQSTRDRHTSPTAAHRHAGSTGRQLPDASAADDSAVDTPDATAPTPPPPVPRSGLASSIWLGGHNKCKRHKGGRDMLPWCAETNRWADYTGQAPRTAGAAAAQSHR